jgi:hypothetical protein
VRDKSESSRILPAMAIRLNSIVQVVDAIDREVHDVASFIGRLGEVIRRGTRDGDTTFAEMFLVGFCDGNTELFWPEELALP